MQPPSQPGGSTTTSTTVPPGQKVITLGVDQEVVVVQGEVVFARGDGFRADADVRITIESTPILLATTRAGRDGRFGVSVRVPLDMSLGRHSLRARGVAANGSDRDLTSTVIVKPAGTGSSQRPLARTGTAIGATVGVALLLVAVGTLVVRRSRRGTPSHSRTSD